MVSVGSPNPRMNAISQHEPDVLALVEIIDLKWLLTGEGVHLHVERLQRDPAYARGILDSACQSQNPTLAMVAGRVRKLLVLDEN